MHGGMSDILFRFAHSLAQKKNMRNGLVNFSHSRRRRRGHGASELAALYIAHNVHVPNQVRKPIVIFITDEMPYDEISVADARDRARVTLQQSIKTTAVFEELNRKFSVYVIQKPYADHMQSQITRRWQDLVGKDRCVLAR
jgi:hypothetical protein